MNDSKYNPYEDTGLHYTKPEEAQPIEDRKGFNEVMDHYDIINGHQVPKKIEHLPKSMRRIIRWAIILWIASFLLFQVWSAIDI
jgi:hypothetical protein